MLARSFLLLVALSSVACTALTPKQRTVQDRRGLADCLAERQSCPAVVSDIEGGHWVRVNIVLDRSPSSVDEHNAMLALGVVWEGRQGHGVVTLAALRKLAASERVISVARSDV